MNDALDFFKKQEETGKARFDDNLTKLETEIEERKPRGGMIRIDRVEFLLEPMNSYVKFLKEYLQYTLSLAGAEQPAPDKRLGLFGNAVSVESVREEVVKAPEKKKVNREEMIEKASAIYHRLNGKVNASLMKGQFIRIALRPYGVSWEEAPQEMKDLIASIPSYIPRTKVVKEEKTGEVSSQVDSENVGEEEEDDGDED